jgi:hypothetical protein
MIGQRNQHARMQSDFYRDCYYKVLRFLLVEIAIMLLLIAVILYVIFFQSSPPYFATTAAGKVIPLVPG